MMTDEQLMLDFQRGSKAAFTELFERYREAVFGYFRRRLEDAARAEDLAQETFMAVLRAVTRYEPRATFRTYIYGIASIQLMAERRKGGQRAAIFDLSSLDPPDTRDPQAVIEIRRALEKLDPEDREVLMLREYEQLSYAEIAALQHAPVNTVRSRLFRARQALKESLVGSHRTP